MTKLGEILGAIFFTAFIVIAGIGILGLVIKGVMWIWGW